MKEKRASKLLKILNFFLIKQKFLLPFVCKQASTTLYLFVSEGW